MTTAASLIACAPFALVWCVLTIGFAAIELGKWRRS